MSYDNFRTTKPHFEDFISVLCCRSKLKNLILKWIIRFIEFVDHSANEMLWLGALIAHLMIETSFIEKLD